MWPLFTLLGRLLRRGFDIDPESYTQEFAFAPPEEILTQGSTRIFDALRFLLSLVLVILVIYLVYRLFRRLLSYTVQTLGPSVTTEQRISLAPGRKTAKRWLYPGDPIRETYRKFLVLCRKAGIERLAHFTSADYEGHAKGKFASLDEAAQFRSLYINVRYGEKVASTEEKRKMKKILASFNAELKRYFKD